VEPLCGVGSWSFPPILEWALPVDVFRQDRSLPSWSFLGVGCRLYPNKLAGKARSLPKWSPSNR